MSDRPMEPCNASEDPEAWAEIAQWESDRADILREALEKIAESWEDPNAYENLPKIARDALARKGE